MHAEAFPASPSSSSSFFFLREKLREGRSENAHSMDKRHSSFVLKTAEGSDAKEGKGGKHQPIPHPACMDRRES